MHDLHPKHRYQFLSESLQEGEFDHALPTYLPMDSDKNPSAKLLQKLFRDRFFPYPKRLSLEEYYDEIYPLQIELVKMQNWVKEAREKVVVVFEGRDAAGKGSTIRKMTEHLNPRGARVVALDKPTETERDQWYFQRYVDHLPTAGEIIFFDRSWYNRAGVERVMGFCSEAEYWEFIEQVPDFERMLVRSGIKLIKVYLSVGRKEQARRFKDRETNPLKQWKLSPVDIEAQARWDAYTQAKEDTFRLTDTDWAPWTIIKAEDRFRARINATRFILGELNYFEKNADIVRSPDPFIVSPSKLIFGVAETGRQKR